MSLVSLLSALVVGALVGGTAAWLHQRATWRASRRLARRGRSTAALLGLPLRIVLPAAAMFPLALWGMPALAAGLVAFGIVGRFEVRRITEEQAG